MFAKPPRAGLGGSPEALAARRAAAASSRDGHRKRSAPRRPAAKPRAHGGWQVKVAPLVVAVRTGDIHKASEEAELLLDGNAGIRQRVLALRTCHLSTATRWLHAAVHGAYHTYD